MSQIQKGETFADGQIVTYDRLNDLVDSAILLPPVINGQTALSPLTGNEETLIYDPASGSLKKCLLKNALLTGNDISTGLISNAIGGVTIDGWTEVRLNAPNIKLQNNATVGSSIDLITHSSIQLSSSNGDIGFSVPNGNITFTSTRGIRLPVGTTAQRPATPAAGEIRYNTTITDVEYYNGAGWNSGRIKVATIRLTLPDNTNFVYPTTNSWASMPLNTLEQSEPFVVNSAAFTGSGTTNTNITLPAGTYSIATSTSIQSYGGGGGTTCRVYNSTTSTEIARGNTAYCNNFSYGQSICYAVFTIAVETTINIQYFNSVTASANPTDGPGAEILSPTLITKLS